MYNKIIKSVLYFYVILYIMVTNLLTETRVIAVIIINCTQLVSINIIIIITNTIITTISLLFLCSYALFILCVKKNTI